MPQPKSQEELVAVLQNEFKRTDSTTCRMPAVLGHETTEALEVLAKLTVGGVTKAADLK